MLHIAVPDFGQPPCHGEIREIPREPEPEPERTTPRHRSLPILGMGAGTGAARPTSLWRCERCNKTWEQEPLPDEAL